MPPKEKPPAAPLDRSKDPAYTNEMAQVRKAEVDVVRRLEPLRANMERMRLRARQVLGAGATEAQVLAELDANPAKYVGWRELKAQMAQGEADLEKQRKQMRAVVQARILKEAAERKAAGTSK